MNKIYKIFAFVLALTLLLSVGTFVFADEEFMSMEEVYAELFEYDEGTETLTLKSVAAATGSSALTMDVVNQICGIVGQIYGVDPITAISTIEIADENVTSIGEQVFGALKNVESIVIPKTVTEISPMAFWGCADSIVIKAEKDTVAHEFAKEYNIEYKKYSTSEKKNTEGDMGQGIVVTILGVVVVFLILIILCIVLKVFEMLFAEKKSAPKAVSAPAPAPVAPAVQDDTELIAVISAAIAASLNVNTSQFNIRSVKRLASSWSQAAKTQNFNNF